MRTFGTAARAAALQSLALTGSIMTGCPVFPRSPMPLRVTLNFRALPLLLPINVRQINGLTQG